MSRSTVCRFNLPPNYSRQINGLKQNGIATSQLCKTVNIARQHCRNLWVTAGRLVIRKQDRRHPVTGNLHGRWLQKACQAPHMGARMGLTAEHSFGHTHQTPQKVRSEIVQALRLKRIALVAPRRPERYATVALIPDKVLF